jgi:hypothetical protein
MSREKAAELRTRGAEYMLLMLTTWETPTLDKCAHIEDILKVRQRCVGARVTHVYGCAVLPLCVS